MRAPILAFCPRELHSVLEGLFADARREFFIVDTAEATGRYSKAWARTIVAYGPEGGVALAAGIERHGIDRVTGIALVGVTAPWAERVKPKWAPCHLFEHDGSCGCNGHIPLGPLEPLRAVAERARIGVSCSRCRGAGMVYSGYTRLPCPVCSDGRASPLRFVVACSPDDGVCAGCEGRGGHNLDWPIARRCEACEGTGKALSSAAVAMELAGGGPWQPIDVRVDVVQGGLTMLAFPSVAELATHGLKAALAELLR